MFEHSPIIASNGYNTRSHDSSGKPVRYPAPSTASAPAAGSVVSGANIFGSSPVSYNWIEYKMSTGSMTAYIKFDKVKGTCTMRFEGAQPQGMPSEMSCGSTGGATQSNPNDVKSDVQYTFVGVEPVSVPAGLYPAASKYTSTYQGTSSTFWTAPGVPGFVKMVTGGSNGGATMELNGWG